MTRVEKRPYSLEQPSAKHSHDNKRSKTGKETLLKALQDLEKDIGDLNEIKLRQRLADLRREVDAVLQAHDAEIERLYAKIENLENEVEQLKTKNVASENDKKLLRKKLVLGQATLEWEAHLARFVIERGRVYEIGKFKQMERFLNKNTANNLWNKIQEKIGDWTEMHEEIIEIVRKERNTEAHPVLIDLDFVKEQIGEMFPDYQTGMENMLDILKMTASLMKFGRLATLWKTSEHPSLLANRARRDALMDIASWDRQFEDIRSLQNINHEEAKNYLERYVDEGAIIEHYNFVVDFIKDENEKGLGKFAWQFEEICPPENISMEEREALDTMKQLLQNPQEKCDVLDPDIAKLHIPDFLPKPLWEHGIKIVDKYKEYTKKN